MYYYDPQFNNQDRQFLFPFLLGGIGGAAIASVARPRPVYVNSPYNNPYGYPYNNRPYGYNYYGGYNYNPYPYYR